MHPRGGHLIDVGDVGVFGVDAWSFDWASDLPKPGQKAREPEPLRSEHYGMIVR
jgi:hypothetical protein